MCPHCRRHGFIDYCAPHAATLTPAPGPWMVLYVRGARIGSRPLTDKPAVLSAFPYLSMIQRDVTGTEHYHVLSPARIEARP